jgi:RNA-directed DNA polymerase
MGRISQNSATNAWNVNINNANVNNNTKTNSNYVRSVADYENRILGNSAIDFEGVIKAYYECRKKKRSSPNELLYEVNAPRRIYLLWKELVTGKYEIGTSIAFIVNKPVKREVFAATFKDRIVHHWIVLRLNPEFEKYLPRECMSNRKGRGTSMAIKKVAYDIKACSENYTKECWIWKFDIQGMFMSIDKRLLNKQLQFFIDERYNKADKDALKWLVEKVVMHCPQKNCRFRSDKSEWVGLAPNKSLFNQDDFHGLAIGNLTSQLFANFFLSSLIRYCKSLGIKYITEYVDDFTVVHPSKAELLSFIPKVRECLKNSLYMVLHPKKFYFQHFSKGVSFVGGIIKPHRIYSSKRTLRNGYLQISRVLHTRNLINLRNSVNSYFGYTKNHYEFKWRQQMASLISKDTENIVFTQHYNSIKLTQNTICLCA